MNLLQALFLGIVQGLTEFLPVSSSGHLVLLQHVFGITEPELLFDVCLHVGTLAAVVVALRREVAELFVGFGRSARFLALRLTGRAAGPFPWKDRSVRLFFLVVAGTLPTGILGVLIQKTAKGVFASAPFAAAMLLVTGLVLLATRFTGKGEKKIAEMGAKEAVAIGLAQGVAVLPGISRSGSTIAAGLFLGVDRDTAARFSFVLSLPAILGAVVLEAASGGGGGGAPPAAVMVGALSAGLTGYFALRFLIRIVSAGGLFWFSPYCFVIGTGALAWLV
ncbi:MAG: undecaprenyl-diphosphate phosphatase [Thermodesulfobacteriota bacterium]